MKHIRNLGKLPFTAATCDCVTWKGYIGIAEDDAWTMCEDKGKCVD